MQKPSIALCMIVRDVAPFIERCLASIVPWCDEIFITDTGSRDDTKNVVANFLKGFPDKRWEILDFNPTTHPQSFLDDNPEIETEYGIPGPFTGEKILADFGAARQLGWSKATSDFLFWIDSDDVVQNADKLQEVIALMDRDHLDGAMLFYEYAHDSNNRVTSQLLRERLVRRIPRSGVAHKWTQPIHEVIFPIGVVGTFEAVRVIHHRQHLPTRTVPYRNLKVLMKTYNALKAAGTPDHEIDARLLCYLGMEWRFVKGHEIKGIDFLKKYVARSGWDEERALAYNWIGEHYEQHGDVESAFHAYSAASVEFPWRPEGIFGCARCFYHRAVYNQDRLGQKDTGLWAKCVELTERGQEVVRKEGTTRSVLQYSPLDREYQPLRFVSRAYVEIGKIREGLAAAEKALSFNPNDEEMKANLALCQKWLAEKESSEAAHNQIRLTLPAHDSLDAPAAEVPAKVLELIALQLWKRIPIDGDRRNRGLARRLTFISSLPDEIRSTDRISAARNLTAKDLGLNPDEEATEEQSTAVRFVPRTSMAAQSPKAYRYKTNTPRDIVIWTGPAFERWCPKNIDDPGIGGSETAAIMMARELAAMGHKVRIIGDCEGLEGFYDDVEYIDYTRVQKNPDITCDVFVCSRQAGTFNQFNITAKLKLLWIHDVHVGNYEGIRAHIEKADRVLALSKWHKEFLQTTYQWIHPDFIHVTRNGIDLARFGLENGITPELAKNVSSKKNNLIFSSSGNRGLELAIRLLKRVRQEVPDASLHVYYGFENWRAFAERSAPDQLPQIRQLEQLMKETQGVFYHGRVGQKELARAFMEAKVWFYPTNFTETSCISAMEAQAAGCVPVTTALAALNETVKYGFKLPTDDQYENEFVKRTVDILKNNSAQADAAVNAMRAALDFSWTNVAREWDESFQVFIDNPVKKSKNSEHHIEITGYKKLRIAANYGFFSSHLHGKFDIPTLYEGRMITGSESSFFNFVKGMAELGHQVDVVCDVPAHVNPPNLGGAHVYPLNQVFDPDYDVYITWNEPDYLRGMPQKSLRICAQQLNDFRSYCNAGYDNAVDAYVMPSDSLCQHLALSEGINRSKCYVIPNPVNPDLILPFAPPRQSKSLVWSSSPDRGLNIILSLFPEVRKRVPEAVLKIFYRFGPWYETVRGLQNETGRRARYINDVFEKYGRYGENGIVLVDAISNKNMYRELATSRALAYTCEPMQYTEGFSVSIMDACANGCAPIISDVDALPEIYGGVAHIIYGRPSENKEAWIQALVRVLTDDQFASEISERAKSFSKKFYRHEVAFKWQLLINDLLRQKHGA